MRKKLKYFLFFVLFIAFSNGCDVASNDGVLSPARDLSGIWKTNFPVTVYTKADYYTPMTTFYSEPWDVTFTITEGAGENDVDIKMSFTQGTWTTITSSTFTGIVPEVSPAFLTGVISSSSFTLYNGSEEAGSFNFTTDIITGTLEYAPWGRDESGYQEHYTDVNTLILTRQ